MPALQQVESVGAKPRVLYGWGQIANYLDVTERVAQRLAYDCGMPTFKLGSRIAAAPTAIDEWIAQRAERRELVGAS
jgi:hypothetical protein